MTLTFGSSLRRLRKRKGLTLEQVAAALGVSYPAVQQWETNKTIPHRGKIDELSNVLGASVIGFYPYDGDTSRIDYTEELLQLCIEDYERRSVLEIEGETLGRDPVLYALMNNNKEQKIESMRHTIKSLANKNSEMYIRILRTEQDDDSTSFSIHNETTGLINKPHSLGFMKYPFAVRMPNASMSPKFERGEIIIFDDVPVKDLKGYALVCHEDERTKKVCDSKVIKIVDTSDSQITGLQFNPIEHINMERRSNTLIYRTLTIKDLVGDLVEKK